VRLRVRGERASVMMLMPAAVLVVIVMAAICVDQSLAFLRQRQASSVAVDVANDLATAALDEARYRSSGTYVLDESRARELGHGLVAGSDVGAHVVGVDIRLAAPDEVVVELTVQVDYVFARALPGAADGTTVTARAAAVAAPG
jgi:hypothetical protein